LNTNASTRSCFPEKAASQKTFALRDDPRRFIRKQPVLPCD